MNIDLRRLVLQHNGASSAFDDLPCVWLWRGEKACNVAAPFPSVLPKKMTGTILIMQREKLHLRIM